MRPEAHQLWHALMSPSGVEDDLPRALVNGSVVKIIKQDRGAFDAHEVRNIESGRREFGPPADAAGA